MSETDRSIDEVVVAHLALLAYPMVGFAKGDAWDTAGDETCSWD